MSPLKQKREKLEWAPAQLADGQKIIIGDMMLALAGHDDAARKRLIELLERNVTRETDVPRIKPLIATL